MPTAYNTDYSLTSADLSALQGFTSPGMLSLGQASAWQQHHLGQAALSSLVAGGQLSQGSNLSINTNQNINIKSEPISPPRDRMTPSGFQQQQQQQPQQQPQQQTSALSPNAKEFIFPNMQGQGSSTNGMFPGDSPLNLSPLQYSNAFDVFAAYGGLNEKSFVDGLNFSLNNIQYSNQQFQPVMAN